MAKSAFSTGFVPEEPATGAVAMDGSTSAVAATAPAAGVLAAPAAATGVATEPASAAGAATAGLPALPELPPLAAPVLLLPDPAT